MKKIYTVFIILGSILTIVGAAFKVLHYAGSSVLLMSGVICSGIALVAIAFSSTKTKV